MLLFPVTIVKICKKSALFAKFAAVLEKNFVPPSIAN